MNNLTNEELISLIKNGEKKYIDELFIRNESGIRLATFNFYKKHKGTIDKFNSFDFDDLLQISNINFMKSIKEFDEERGVKYITFLMNYIYWKLSSYFFKHGKIKFRLRSSFNNLAILDDTQNENDEGEIEYINPSEGWHVPEYEIDFESSLIIDDALATLRKKRDRNIIRDFYLNGYSLEDISEKYEIVNVPATRTLIYKIVQRLKRNNGNYEENN